MEKKLSLSQQIAEIGAGLKFEDLPERVVNNSKMFIMDLLGNIIASRHVDSSLTCLKAVRELGDGDPVSTAIGCNYKTTPQMAALINGTFGTPSIWMTTIVTAPSIPPWWCSPPFWLWPRSTAAAARTF